MLKANRFPVTIKDRKSDMPKKIFKSIFSKTEGNKAILSNVPSGMHPRDLSPQDPDFFVLSLFK
jgi:hypothetical protein